jgi:hypothetical protein
MNPAESGTHYTELVYIMGSMQNKFKTAKRTILLAVPDRKLLFSPISVSPMSGIYASLRQAQIIILEILNVWMPVPLSLSGVVIIFAFLDLGKNP